MCGQNGLIACAVLRSRVGVEVVAVPRWAQDAGSSRVQQGGRDAYTGALQDG